MSDQEIAGKIAGSIPQSHGGALLPGGVKGHKGGPGRPPTEIRQRCAETFDRHIGKAEAILKSKKSSSAEKLKALDLLGKYGGLIKTEVERTDGALEQYLRERRERKRSA